MQFKVNKKIPLIFYFLFIGFISCFFIPKLDRLAWRMISVCEFKTLKILSIVLSKPYDETVFSKANLASHRGVFSENIVENSEKSIIGAVKKNFGILR